MTKAFTWFIVTVAIFSFAAAPSRAHADKFFEDNDFFFLKYLNQKNFSLDTSAPAVVLYDAHSYNLSSSITRVRRIIKVTKKSGVKYGDIFIAVPGNRYGDYRVKNVHGYTYNLDDGKLVRQRIDEENVSIEKTKLIKEKKIIMPSVREGSIIDCSYEIEGAISLEWQVQEEIPKLYSEIEIKYPREMDFEESDQVVPAFFVLDNKINSIPDSLLPYSYTFTKPLPDDKLCTTWVRRNIHAFEDEPYISSRSNYCETMMIYLNSYHLVFEHTDLVSWDRINKALLTKFFDKPLTESRQAVKEKVRELVGDDTSDLNIAKTLFRYVRDSIRTKGNEGLYTNEELAKIIKNKSGTIAGKNLLLVVMLRDAGLHCSPVILATTERGTPGTTRPDILKYNHTICQLRINQEKYYLDASEKYYPFGALSPKCMNGYARIIDKNDPGSVFFKPDMITEKDMFMVTTTNTSAADYTLNFKLYYGTENAARHRELWNEDPTEIKKHIMGFFKDFPAEIKLEQYKAENLHDPDAQLTLDFSISFAMPGNTLYLDPYIVKFFKENPFKSPDRKYDISFPYAQYLTYICKLKLPQGYGIEDVPKSGVVKIGDDVQFKNYITYDKESNELNIDSRLEMLRINFDKSEYSVVKEFFEKMMEEQQTNLVIKKQS